MGRAADSNNRRNIIVIGCFIWNAALAGMGSSTAFWELLVYRLVLGFGQAFSNPASYSMITDLFPPDQRPFANGLFATGSRRKRPDGDAPSIWGSLAGRLDPGATEARRLPVGDG